MTCSSPATALQTDTAQAPYGPSFVLCLCKTNFFDFSANKSWIGEYILFHLFQPTTWMQCPCSKGLMVRGIYDCRSFKQNPNGPVYTNHVLGSWDSDICNCNKLNIYIYIYIYTHTHTRNTRPETYIIYIYIYIYTYIWMPF